MEASAGIIGIFYALAGLTMAFGSWIEARSRSESAGPIVLLTVTVWPMALLLIVFAWMIAKIRAR